MKKKSKADIYRRLRGYFHRILKQKHLHTFWKGGNISEVRKHSSAKELRVFGSNIWPPSCVWMWAGGLNPRGFSVTSTNLVQAWRFAHTHEDVEMGQSRKKYYNGLDAKSSWLPDAPGCMLYLPICLVITSAHVCVYIYISVLWIIPSPRILHFSLKSAR